MIYPDGDARKLWTWSGDERLTDATPRGTKADFIADQLRQGIATGVIPPGELIEQRDIAERFGMSPTPVREALNQLAAEGLLVRAPNRTLRVVHITQEGVAELREVYLMRTALERLATELAHEHISRASVAEIQRINDAMADAAALGDLQGVRTLNYSFHMRIYQSAQSPRLLESIQRLWLLLPWETLWLQGDLDGPLTEHRAIIEALSTGTAADAAELVVHHIERAYTLLVDSVEAGQLDAISAPVTAKKRRRVN